MRDPSDGSVRPWPRKKRPDYELDEETRENSKRRIAQIRDQLKRGNRK